MAVTLFDTHADTPYELYKRGLTLNSNTLHISKDKARALDGWCQCMAIWSDKALTGDLAFLQFKKIFEYFKRLTENEKDIALVKDYSQINEAISNNKAAFLLTVEDARLLSDDIGRLDLLYECGVRMLTLQWQGNTLTGGGYDTDDTLTEYGKRVIKRCSELGIIPDISHANENTAKAIIEASIEYGSPVIATHSNSFAVCPHKRNMTDSLFSALVQAGGIVGISLAPMHLTRNMTATSEDVFSHIDHYADRHGIEHICLGCDLDGIESTPKDIRDLSEIENIAEIMLRHNYKESYVNAVFSDNAKRYMQTYLK